MVRKPGQPSGRPGAPTLGSVVLFAGLVYFRQHFAYYRDFLWKLLLEPIEFLAADFAYSVIHESTPLGQ